MSKDTILTTFPSKRAHPRGRNSTIGELLPENIKWRMEQLAKGRSITPVRRARSL